MNHDRPARRLWADLGLVAVIRGTSQEPEFHAGDFVLAIRPWRSPRVGELVLADMGGYLVIKRIAGVDPECERTELELHGGGRRWIPTSAIVARVVLALTWDGVRAARLRYCGLRGTQRAVESSTPTR